VHLGNAERLPDMHSRRYIPSTRCFVTTGHRSNQKTIPDRLSSREFCVNWRCTVLHYAENEATGAPVTL
jgi:hypothetical protein